MLSGDVPGARLVVVDTVNGLAAKQKRARPVLISDTGRGGHIHYGAAAAPFVARVGIRSVKHERMVHGDIARVELYVHGFGFIEQVRVRL